MPAVLLLVSLLVSLLVLPLVLPPGELLVAVLKHSRWPLPAVEPKVDSKVVEPRVEYIPISRRSLN
tara:strand:+ start:5149 stop:5346 length:198 start_codon:yes stop_codon:yes gene_type:complete